MARGLEAAHVDADLCDQHLCCQGADTRDSGQLFDSGAKGFDVRAHLLVDVGDGRVDGVDLIQVQLEQEAFMRGDSATQRRLQFIRGRVDAPMRQRGQDLQHGLAGDQSFEDAAAGHTEQIGHHRVELDVGVLQRLLDVLDVAGADARRLLAGSEQIAHLLRGFVGHPSASLRAGYAGANQPLRQQIGQPDGIVGIGIPPRHVLHMRGVPPQRRRPVAGDPGVGQYQLELAVEENEPDRLPVDASGLHGDVRTACGREPVGKRY